MNPRRLPSSSASEASLSLFSCDSSLSDCPSSSAASSTKRRRRRRPARGREEPEEEREGESRRGASHKGTGTLEEGTRVACVAPSLSTGRAAPAPAWGLGSRTGGAEGKVPEEGAGSQEALLGGAWEALSLTAVSAAAASLVAERWRAGPTGAAAGPGGGAAAPGRGAAGGERGGGGGSVSRKSSVSDT